VKLVIFVSILAFVGNLARLGRLARTRPIVPGELACRLEALWFHGARSRLNDRAHLFIKGKFGVLNAAPTKYQEPKTQNHEAERRLKGWDDYADFYDWEKCADARSPRRAVLAGHGRARERPGTGELGCGHGPRDSPDRADRCADRGSGSLGRMLEYARRRAARSKSGSNVSLVRSDIRSLPFRKSTRFRPL